MAVKIRLARFGRNKVPFYHIVVTDSRNRRDSKFIEKIGTFNPLLDDESKDKIVIKKDRAEYWLGVGAIPTDRAALIMIKVGVKGAEKYKPVFTPKAKAVKEEPKKEETVQPAAEESSNETPAVDRTGLSGLLFLLLRAVSRPAGGLRRDPASGGGRGRRDHHTGRCNAGN